MKVSQKMSKKAAATAAVPSMEKANPTKSIKPSKTVNASLSSDAEDKAKKVLLKALTEADLPAAEKQPTVSAPQANPTTPAAVARVPEFKSSAAPKIKMVKPSSADQQIDDIFSIPLSKKADDEIVLSPSGGMDFMKSLPAETSPYSAAEGLEKYMKR